MAGLGLTFFDIGAIVFLLIFLVVGMVNGFLKEISKIIIWAGSLIGAKILTYTVEPIVYNFLKVGEELKLNITRVVENVDFTSLESLRRSLEAGLEDVSLIGPLLDGLVQENWTITDIYQKGSATMQSDLIKYIMDAVDPIAHNVVGLGTFVGLFVILMFVLTIVVNLIIRGVTSVKIVGVADNLLGGVLGAVKGCLFFVIFYSLAFVILSVSGSEYLTVLMDSKFFDIVVGIKDILPSA
jgi:uncharacterized membrane protein required for colicin V production